MYGRPDLAVTSSPDKPTALTTLRIIECKCCKHLGAHDIRAEFGKAYDFRVAAYLIWSFWTPSPKSILGAKRLGIDLVTLGFDSPQRADLTAHPDYLVAHVTNTIEATNREKRFAKALLDSGEDIKRKLLVLK